MATITDALQAREISANTCNFDSDVYAAGSPAAPLITTDWAQLPLPSLQWLCLILFDYAGHFARRSGLAARAISMRRISSSVLGKNIGSGILLVAELDDQVGLPASRLPREACAWLALLRKRKRALRNPEIPAPPKCF